MQATMDKIEAEIGRLSFAEQLLLIERLSHRLRTCVQQVVPFSEDELATMAEDLDIQREIRAIEKEFACTEADGLGLFAE